MSQYHSSESTFVRINSQGLSTHLFRSFISDSGPRKFDNWNPKVFRQHHVGSFMNFCADMYKIKRGTFAYLIVSWLS